MFTRCGLEVEFDFSLPKTKKAKTDDYPPRERTAKVEAKRRDLQERIKAELSVNNRHHQQLLPSDLISPSQVGNCAKRNVVANTGDVISPTRSVTQAEYDLFKENKRVERYALWEHGFHLPDPPNVSPAPQPRGANMHHHMDIDNGTSSQYFHDSPKYHANSSSESSPVLLSHKLSSHSPSSSRYCSHSSPSTPRSTTSNNNQGHNHDNHDNDDGLQQSSEFISTDNHINDNDDDDDANDAVDVTDIVPSTLLPTITTLQQSPSPPSPEHQDDSSAYSYIEEEYYWEIDMRSTNKLFDSEPFTFAGVRFKMTFAPAYMQLSSHPDPDTVDGDGGDGGPTTSQSSGISDSYANPKYRGSRTTVDVHQRTNRVVKGALCFSPVATKPRSRTIEAEDEAMVESSDKWTSIPSTSDVSTSSSGGRSASTARRQGLQLLTTPMLQSIPRGYSFLLSLAQGHPTNPRSQHKQVVVHCEFKVRGLLRPAFLRSAGNLIFSDTANTHSHTSPGSASSSNCGAYRGFQTFMGPELLGYLEHGMLTLSVAMRSHAYEGQLIGVADGSPITPPFLPLPVPQARVKRARSTHPIDATSNTPTPSAEALAAATTLSTVATHQVPPSQRSRNAVQSTLDLVPHPTHSQRRRLSEPPPVPPCPNEQMFPPLEDIYLQRDSPNEVFIAGNPKTAWGQHQHQQHLHKHQHHHQQQQQMHHHMPLPRKDLNDTSGITNNQPKNTMITNPVDISPAAATVSVVTSTLFPTSTRNLARRRLAPRLITTTTHSL